MDFQQIRDFVNPAVAQATGLQEVENLAMPVPVAYVPVQLVIDGALSLTSENPVQNKVIAVAIQQLDGRITAIEGQFSEGVTEAVNNWLDAHPEATTTVQDGAISYAKFDNNLKGDIFGLSSENAEAIPANSDLDNYTSTGNYKVTSNAIAESVSHVPEVSGGALKVLSTIAESRILQMYITNTEPPSIWVRNNMGSWGEWNKLGWSNYGVDTEYDSVGSMVDIAETYFNVAYDKNNKLIYSSQHGLFTDPVTEMDEKAIVCSQFSQACMAGIAYSNSRYVLGATKENEPFWWGWKSDGTGVYYNTGSQWYAYAKDYMRASEQFAYFQRKGIVHEFSADHVDIKPGDILFFLASVFDETVEEDYISHTGICLRAYKDRYTMMHSDGEHTRLVDGADVGVRDAHWAYSNRAPSYYVHCDDIPIIKAKTQSTLVAKKLFNVSGTYDASTVFIGGMSFTPYLERGFYTVNIETLGSCDGYIRVYYDETDIEEGITIPAQYKYGQNLGGKTSIVFYAELPVKKIDVRVQSSQSGSPYNVQNCYIYRGYHSPDD